MAVGDTHRLENDTIRVIFTEHATYGVVLTSIENLVDGAVQEFVAQSLFRCITRKVQVADSFTTFEADDATTTIVDGIGRLEVGEGNSGVNTVGESPILGARNYFAARFFFDNIASTTDDFALRFSAQLLDDAPERVLFAIIFDQTRETGSNTMVGNAFFWCAPILLAIEPYDSDQYLNGMNAGLTTKSPQTDLVGNGSTYRFNTGSATSIGPGALYPAVGFEPEAQPTQFTDRMEIMYPQWMSSAMAAYGSQEIGEPIVYVHDNLHFHPRRVRDWYDGTNIVIEHEALIPNGITAGNGWGDVPQWRADTYVAVFKRNGDVMGEEVGHHYRRWSQSSPEALEVMPPKAKDCPKMAPIIQESPIYRPYFPDDDEYETGITEEIAEEFRMAFPALADVDAHPLYRVNYDLLYEYNNDSSGTLPGNVGNTSSDLFSLSGDAGKLSYAEELDAEYGLWTWAGIVSRAATPHDGRGFFASDGMSAARVRNHHDALNGSLPTVDDFLKYTKTVAAVSFSGGFTKITMSAGAFDPILWNIFSNYAHTTAGIDHSGHISHLGYLAKNDVSYAFPIEKQSQANFIANPPILWVAGNRTATILVGDSLNIFFSQPQYVPGYRVGVGFPFPTNLCCMADEIGNEGATSGGWATRYIDDLINYAIPALRGLQHVGTRSNMICWHNHGGEIPGSNQQLLAWRRTLREWKNQLWALTPTLDGEVVDPWVNQIWDEDGPYDWLLGVIDGHTRVSRRLDLTTIPGSWGQSPFFQVAWGDRYRFGGHFADREGHITNYLGPTIYEEFFIEPTESSKYREAMVADFTHGRLPSFGVYPAADGQLGVRPDGQPAYTPFFHATHGMTVEGTYAQMFARLTQASLFFEMAHVRGLRVRSLRRKTTTLVDCNFLLDVAGHGSWHAIGADENGRQRAPLMHMVMRDHLNPRRLIAYFINDYPSSTRASAYEFDPALYQDVIPLGGEGYRVTRYRAEHDEVVEVESKWKIGKHQFPVSLDPSGVEMYVFDFSSGLRFVYAYDDEELREVAMPIDQKRHRIEDIHGAGELCIWGFKNELPDQDIAIAKVFLRIFAQGRSETR